MKLGEHFLGGKVFLEHHNEYERGYQVDEKDLPTLPAPILFKNRENCFCFAINKDLTVTNSYYVGVF